jgi:hypothetical protein
MDPTSGSSAEPRFHASASPANDTNGTIIPQQRLLGWGNPRHRAGCDNNPPRKQWRAFPPALVMDLGGDESPLPVPQEIGSESQKPSQELQLAAYLHHDDQQRENRRSRASSPWLVAIAATTSRVACERPRTGEVRLDLSAEFKIRVNVPTAPRAESPREPSTHPTVLDFQRYISRVSAICASDRADARGWRTFVPSEPRSHDRGHGPRSRSVN